MDDIWNKPVNDLPFTVPMLKVLERQKIATCGELFVNFAAYMMAASGMAAGAELFIQTDRGVKLRQGAAHEPKVGMTMIEGMKRRAASNVQRQVNERVVRQFGATHPDFNELKPLMSAMLEAAMPHLNDVEGPNQIAPMLEAIYQAAKALTDRRIA
jgi:hypothetical protein